MENKIQNIISKMTLEDKIKLCSGRSFWETKAMEEYGIPSFFMSDGPHGLRTQTGAEDHLGINESERATCFPTACASASSWNPELLKQMGEAIGEEALNYGVDVVLGPGVNIKRNPLCGRNFEYFSEDPYLSGVLGASWIKGVQSKGVGTSLKHFAANNQEQDRMNGDSIVDERALREIYLSAFEMAVKEAKPDTIMCSYNKINGKFSSDNKMLLTDILRKEWGFEGLVVTDWGAMNDRIEAFKAGCELEMPTSCGFFDEEVKRAVEEGKLKEEDIDACVKRILTLTFKAESTRAVKAEIASAYIEEHHALARKIAEESAVLLKNEEAILPISNKKKVVLCGAMAENVRYQGAGSSHINPFKLSNILEYMQMQDNTVVYYPAYELDGERNEEKLKQAIEGSKDAEVVVVAIGLPDSYESEGYDREHMKLPESHNELIHELVKIKKDIVVVLMGGSPVEMPWAKDVNAILNLYLSGQAAGEAAVNLLYGKANPSGKLAETYPISYQDCSSSETFGVNTRQVEYAESIYVGYRYYDKAGIPVQFPFGYGLSYTTFDVSNLRVSKDNINFATANPTITVQCKVKNTGNVAGAQVIQVYLSDKTQDIFKANKELKGFCKVFLEPEEEKEVTIQLNKRAFSHYDVRSKAWEVLSGTYEIYVGTSLVDTPLSRELHVQGTVDALGYGQIPQWYIHPAGKPSLQDFEVVYGDTIKPFELEKAGEFTLLNTLNDMKDNVVVQQIISEMTKGILASCGGDENNPEYIFTSRLVLNTPLIRLVQQSGGNTPMDILKVALDAANTEQN